MQWRHQEFLFGGNSPGDVGDGGLPVRSRGKALVGGLEDEVPQKLDQSADIVYRFWLHSSVEA